MSESSVALPNITEIDDLNGIQLWGQTAANVLKKFQFVQEDGEDDTVYSSDTWVSVGTVTQFVVDELTDNESQYKITTTGATGAIPTIPYSSPFDTVFYRLKWASPPATSLNEVVIRCVGYSDDGTPTDTDIFVIDQDIAIANGIVAANLPITNTDSGVTLEKLVLTTTTKTRKRVYVKEVVV